ncbi:MAG: hypothetical protein JO035_15185, partial [Betaproteobacteria bacterium]|nr:hypothetical protein [Betaproteobacteria bacterium]
MLSLEDCLALCELTEDEVLAIGEHENIPEVVAAEMGHYLVHTADGQLRIKAMIKDDIASAAAAGDHKHAGTLRLVLRQYVCGHPGCDERRRAELRLLERRQA